MTFLAASNILKNEDIKFLIVGSGPMKKELIRFKLRNKLSKVHILGGKSNVTEYYEKSNIFCALSPVENIWSTTVQEALCMGKACILTDSGYTKKVLKPNEAYIIPSKSPDKLADAILYLKNNAEFLNLLSTNALKFRKLFDIGATTDELLKVYSKLLT